MADRGDPSTAAEQRAFAVAKLKRAASLPRMQNGRRPPMHVDGVSEGEIAPGDRSDANTPNSLNERPTVVDLTTLADAEQEGMAQADAVEHDRAQEEQEEVGHLGPEPIPIPEPEHERTPDLEPESEDVPHTPHEPAHELESERASAPSPSNNKSTKRKRRRSRSRSRGSKDLKNLTRPGASPVPSPSPAPNALFFGGGSDVGTGYDSSPDHSPAPLPLPQLAHPHPPTLQTPLHPLQVPGVLSPIPSHFMQLQQQRARSPISPLSNYPGTSPSTPMPTLEQIHLHGLMRSNSAAARLMAMSKLTGEPSTMEMLSPVSPSTSPMPSLLMRNNTVAGGETRNAARTALFKQLANRNRGAMGKEPGDTSGEDSATGGLSPFSTPRRQLQKLNVEMGVTGTPVVDDRELSSTAPNTPIPGPEPLAPSTSQDATEPLPGGSPFTPPWHLGGNTPRQHHADTLLAPPTPRNRRSVVVEEDDGPEYPPTARPPGLGLPPPPPIPRTSTPQRLPHTSDAPSATSQDSGGRVGVPFFLEDQTTHANEPFPRSPWQTPLKERPSRDGQEEAGLYDDGSGGGRLTVPVYQEPSDREPSWVDHPELSPTSEVFDEDEDEDEERVHEPLADADGDGDEYEHRHLCVGPEDDSFARTSVASKPTAELERSLEITDSFAPSSPSAVALSPQSSTSQMSEQDDSFRFRPQPHLIPQSLAPQPSSSTSGAPAPRTPEPTAHSPRPILDGPDAHKWEDVRPAATPEPTRAQNAWEKVKNTFVRSRSNSISGGRSREHTDSSVSRESHASLGDRSDAALGLTAPVGAPMTPLTPPMLSPSASASYLSLPRGVSPIPPPVGSVDWERERYGNSKLQPFPGIKRLEEERNKAKGLPMSLSTPDVNLAIPGPSPMDAAHSSSSSTTYPGVAGTNGHGDESERSRKISHQASDGQLHTRFGAGFLGPPALSAQTSTTSQSNGVGGATGLHAPPLKAQSSGNDSVRGSKERKMKWLQGVFSPISPSASQSQNQGQSDVFQAPPRSPPVVDIKPQQGKASKKVSLSDLLRLRPRDEDAAADRERMPSAGTGSDSTPTSATVQGFGRQDQVQPQGLWALPPTHQADVHLRSGPHPNGRPVGSDDSVPRTRHAPQLSKPRLSLDLESPDLTSAFPSPPEHLSSATPDPQSSLDEYNRSTSESGSTISSSYSTTPAHIDGDDEDDDKTQGQGPVVLQRLDEMLARGSRSPMWASAVDDPPRKLILSSPVLQVVNSNTVKDRFLFLFSDLLIVAKPVQVQDPRESFTEAPLDRQFTVKSVVRLRELRFAANRDESAVTVPPSTKQPAVRAFVQQFAQDPEQAVSSLTAKLSTRSESADVAQLLFRLLEIDRIRLGEYFCKRSARGVLKAFIDGFPLVGLRLDRALRAFLQSIVLPTKSSTLSPLDYLLDTFAARWYEGNATRVPYDKDMAVRLTRAIVQLNNVLHGGISGSPGHSDRVLREVPQGDFIAAFRKYDQRCLVADELLGQIYDSIRHERLVQRPTDGRQPLPITLKRPLPARLTYRAQSEPIFVRLPQQDPHLQIMLYGEDLVFDPPVLTFDKSLEASFRVTGTSFGARKILMLRSGPNAARYAGLPLSSPVVIERAFMRYTFQLAFPDRRGEKRRYMFSVDEALKRHQWTVSLKTQIGVVQALTNGAAMSPPAPGTSRFHRAAESVAFRVLQDALLTPIHGPEPSAAVLDKALQKFVTSPRHEHANGNGNGNGDARFRQRGRLTQHARSKSRSKVYHRHGPGRMELELDALNATPDPEDEDPRRSQQEGKVWSGRDLEMFCQQNSSIVLVLAYLQIGSPDHGGISWPAFVKS